MEVAQRKAVGAELHAAQPAASGPVIECPKPDNSTVPAIYAISKWRTAEWQQRHDKAEAKRLECEQLKATTAAAASTEATANQQQRIANDSSATDWQEVRARAG